MKSIPAIKRVMTPFPYSVDVNISVPEARTFMREQRIKHLPVTEEGKLVGIISDRDLLNVLVTNESDSTVRVRDIYVEEPYVVDLNDRLDNVLYTMAERRIGSALVTRHGKLAGVFTVTDACRSFAEFLRAPLKPAGGDEAA